MTQRILIVDDDADQCVLLESMLARLGYTADTTTSAQEALERIAKRSAPYGAILTDLGMHEMSGLELCQRLVAAAPNVPVIVVTGDDSMDGAISAIRTGAFDYLTKPVDAKLLGLSAARATHRSRLLSELERLKQNSQENATLLGDSPAMRRVQELIARVAPSDAAVLISGETGSGKELVARALHQASSRANGPFVAINCAAVPANLLESELFGHAKGAFTDAKSARDGLFLNASGGTLFLDEIGDMAPEMQSKLLRALQERKVRPVGSNVEIPFNARVFAATHRDLEVEVRERRFRQDLYYRINVVCVDVPPLRERTGDTLKLASHFLTRFCERTQRPQVCLSPQVAERLLAYDWPGNVRELENCMERVAALSRYDLAVPEDLPETLRAQRDDSPMTAGSASEEIVKLDELERRHILRTLERFAGNKSRTAEVLGLDRRTLYRKLDQYRNPPQANASSAVPPMRPRSGEHSELNSASSGA